MIVLQEQTLPDGCHSIKQYFKLVSHVLRDKNWDSVQNYIMVEWWIGQPKDRAFYSDRKEKTPEKKRLYYKK